MTLVGTTVCELGSTSMRRSWGLARRRPPLTRATPWTTSERPPPGGVPCSRWSCRVSSDTRLGVDVNRISVLGVGGGGTAWEDAGAVGVAAVAAVSSGSSPISAEELEREMTV